MDSEEPCSAELTTQTIEKNWGIPLNRWLSSDTAKMQHHKKIKK